MATVERLECDLYNEQTTADLVNDLYHTKSNTDSFDEMVKELVTRDDYQAEVDRYYRNLLDDADVFYGGLLSTAAKLKAVETEPKRPWPKGPWLDPNYGISNREDRARVREWLDDVLRDPDLLYSALEDIEEARNMVDAPLWLGHVADVMQTICQLSDDLLTRIEHKQ
jgi:hypothetical protein